jgi:hypothetical protein
VKIADETEGSQLFIVSSVIRAIKPLPDAHESLILHAQGFAWRRKRTPNIGVLMNKVLVGVVSAAEFERARERIFELSDHCSYDDWLDGRYGRFMGLSLGGADAALVTVALNDFLNWCGDCNIRPSEAALDAFALQSTCRSREPVSAA